MSLVLDVPFGLSDIEKVFQVSEMLDNTDELVDLFLPEVSKFLVREGFFKGPFLREYNKQFNVLVQSLIRTQIVNHFGTYTPEEIVLLSDLELLHMLAPKLFDKQTYQVSKLN